jgi:RimJ/RimL family protein N-acetyltransferase
MALELTGVDLLTETITTARLLLRPWLRADAEDIVACCNDPDIANWLPLLPSPYTLPDAHTFIADMAWAQQRAGTGLPLAMEDAATGHLVGSIGIGGITNVRGAEIGYWVAAFSRGRGYAAEATAVLAAWAFGHGLHRVQLLAATGNVPSQRVAKRAGFLREGVLRVPTAAGTAYPGTWCCTAGCPPMNLRRTFSGGDPAVTGHEQHPFGPWACCW